MLIFKSDTKNENEQYLLVPETKVLRYVIVVPSMFKLAREFMRKTIN